MNGMSVYLTYIDHQNPFNVGKHTISMDDTELEFETPWTERTFRICVACANRRGHLQLWWKVKGIRTPQMSLWHIYDNFFEDKGIQTSSIRGLEAMLPWKWLFWGCNILGGVQCDFKGHGTLPCKITYVGTFSKNGASKSKLILHPKNPGMS